MDIRLVRPGDIVACNDFHNAAYRRRRSIMQWRWEFASQQLPDKTVPYALVEDQGRIAGTQALIPIRMIDTKGTFWTAKSEETLVDLEYRGRKLFERMYELLFDYARQHSMRDIWGFTPATRAFVRLGFKVPGQTRQLLFPLRGEAATILIPANHKAWSRRLQVWTAGTVAAAAAQYSAMRILAISRDVRKHSDGIAISLRTLDAPPDGAAELCRTFVSKWGGATIYRDAAYLQWRLFSNPHVRPVVRAAYAGERLLGWLAFSIGDEGMGYIVDVFVASGSTTVDEDEAAVGLLLCDAVVSLRSMGAVAVRGWRVNDHPFDLLVTRVARRLGFFHIRRGHAVVVHSFAGQDGRNESSWSSDPYVSRIYTEGLAG